MPVFPRLGHTRLSIILFKLLLQEHIMYFNKLIVFYLIIYYPGYYLVMFEIHIQEWFMKFLLVHVWILQWFIYCMVSL